MSYILEYPYTEEQLNDFIVEHSHQQGLQIETVDNFVEVEIETENIEDETLTKTEIVNMPTYYALEPNEILINGEVIINENYEQEQQEKEREQIAKLSLTKREVFLGLYQAIGVTPDMIKAQIIDPQALIEFEYANDYYRGNPLIDVVGATLGITPEQLDKFFETKDYTYLISEPSVDNSEPVDEENSVADDIPDGEDVNNLEE